MKEQEPPNHLSLRGSFERVALISVAIIIVAVAIALLTGCATKAVAASTKRKTTKKKARITYYTGRHEKVAMNGHRAVQGLSLAAHPKYKFGTKIVIPALEKYIGDKEFEVQDRGSAVTSRKASHKTADVFDIYVGSNKTMRWMQAHAPEYMEYE